MKSMRPFNTDKYRIRFRSEFPQSVDYGMFFREDYEIYFFLSGDVRYVVEGKIFYPKKNSVLLIRPNTICGAEIVSDKIYSRYAFAFCEKMIPIEHRKTLLSPFFSEQIYFENIMLEPLFQRVIEATKIENSELLDLSITVRIESILSEICTMSNDTIFSQTDTLTYRIVQYLNAHITEKISIEHIAKEFFISRNQLCKLFKDDMGITLHNYIGFKRSIIAKEMITKGENATTAYKKCGFSDYSTFYRTYKKFIGTTPKSYSRL